MSKNNKVKKSITAPENTGYSKTQNYYETLGSLKSVLRRKKKKNTNKKTKKRRKKVPEIRLNPPCEEKC